MRVETTKPKSKHPRSVDGFCARHGICKATFYNLLRQNRGPRVMKIGALTRITEEAEAEWLRQMDSGASNSKAA